MSFNSVEFILFFALVYAIYLSLNFRKQNRFLLAASYVFYGFWDWRFLCLILISTVTDYLCGLSIGGTEDKKKRRALLLVSLTVNLSILGFFKYFNFFLDNLYSIFSVLQINLDKPTLNIILPVGISFYTFQTLSYTIDVYRKEIKPERNILDYALYVSFFPQLVAGPIERAKKLLPQIRNPRYMSRGTLYEGFFLVSWGYFKKKFIVDNIASFLPFYYKLASSGSEPGGGSLVMGVTIAFLIQLYGDFSAYSDIARGTARLMGFNIINNFKAPFYAVNIQDVWNRWHISLTTWIRDYLYYPLATVKIGRKYLHPLLVVIITFVIMGLWHGASWNYILWGFYNGVLLSGYAVIYRKTKRFRNKKHPATAWFLRILSTLLTFHLAAFGLIFFQTTSVAQLSVWLSQIFTDFSFSPPVGALMLKTLLYASPLLIVDYFIFQEESTTRIIELPAVVKFAFVYIIIYLMIVFRASSTNFIYFQF